MELFYMPVASALTPLLLEIMSWTKIALQALPEISAGKVEEGLGRVTRDAQTQAKGMADQAIGTAQDFYGQAADAAHDTAVTFDKWLRSAIETQPYTTAIMA
jgi:uncharacterized protein YjbJ (UPF0337 family)